MRHDDSAQQLCRTPNPGIPRRPNEGRKAITKRPCLPWTPTPEWRALFSQQATRATIDEVVAYAANYGRWIAYTSSATGRAEVYVRPFPGPGETIMVSTQGGSSPAWNPNGRELFYVEPGHAAGTDRMMVMALDPQGRTGRPVPLFAFDRGSLFLGTSVFTPYAVSRDGQQFYTVRHLPRVVPPVTEINVVFNWAGHLR